MKHQWLAYLIVALLSIGAGVAIAGLPDNTSASATVPPTSIATTTTTTEAPAPTTTAPPTTVPETTEPDTTSSTTAPETTEPETTAPDTTEPDDSVPAELADRGELSVAAANGANVAGAAARVATQLEELGYVEVLPLNGSDIVEFTTVYYADGFEEAALRLAEDLALLPDFVAPLDDAPSVADLPDDIELLVYIGRDRA